MRTGPSGERGSVTAEFAVALPAVVAVLAVVVAAVLAAGTTTRLQVAAAATARALGREDRAAADAASASLAPEAAMRIRRPVGLVCVTASRPFRIAVLPPVALSAEGCSLDGGR